MEELIQVDKCTARRLWDNNCDIALASPNNITGKNYPSNRNYTEVRDFDKRVNAFMFYNTKDVFYFARPQDVKDLKYANPAVEKVRNEERAKIEDAKCIYFGKKTGNFYDAIVMDNENNITHYKALTKGNEVYIQFEYCIEKPSNKTTYIELTRVDNVTPIRRDTMEKDAVFALKNWYDNGVRRVKVLDLAKGQYEDYDTGKIYENKDLVFNLGQKISQRTLNTVEKNGMVIIDDGVTREVYRTFALMNQIDRYYKDGRIDRKTKDELAGGIRDGEGKFRTWGTEEAVNLLKDDMDELAPHLRDEYFPVVDRMVVTLPSMKRVGEITDEVFNLLDIECKTPMRKEMKEILAERVCTNMGDVYHYVGKAPMYQVFKDSLEDLYDEGRNGAPGGMDYTDTVRFFHRHEGEIHKTGDEVTSVNAAFNDFILDVVNKLHTKEKEINQLTLRKTMDLSAGEQTGVDKNKIPGR